MPTDYDAIADGYKRAKQQPWRHHIETFTLLDVIGSLDGRKVVDLACGEGFYTRLLRAHGASEVLGIDLSEGMIHLAREEEENNALGIDYQVNDVRSLNLDRKFDLAIAAYLLNYARNESELLAMCVSIANCLRPGGRFVTVNANPEMDFRRLPSFRQYGFDVGFDGEVVEGTPFTWTFYLEDGPISVENYHLGLAAHERSLRSAGFVDVVWHRPRLSPDRTGEREGFWSTFLKEAPVIFMECRLPTSC
ncbi:MAG: hypothetical protein JWN86_117 [Planctomycetota bacterium]|nr:hypothetical protein [Planctomycetota bacterium]